jgi:DNA polymerase-3 subunit beta
MNLTCSRAELREALRLVTGVVDPKNIKPILKDIRLNATAEGLEISATDLEVGIKYLVRDVEVKQTGGIVIPADPIHGIVTESRTETLHMESQDTKLVLTCAGNRFNIMGVSEEEFPEIPDFPEEAALEMEGAILREMIDKTVFAVAVEKQRYALNGVLFVTKEKATRIEMVATDGRRLAMIRRKANVGAPATASAIIPVKALQQLHKMIGEEEIVKISLQERQVLMRGENGVLVAQLVEGRFPPYKEVIPEDCDKKLEVESEELGNAVRQAAVLTMRDSRAVSMKLSETARVIESSNPEAGDAHVEFGGKFEGEPIEIRFNPDLLLDGVKVMSGDSVRFEMKDRSRAAVMRTGSDYLYLVMPITQE